MKKEFDNIQQQRVYIRNFIDRHYIGSKECTVCGKEPTTIVHNVKEPYKVSFVCKECRMKLKRDELSNLPKVNILEHIENNKKFSHSDNLILDGRLKFIIEHALTTEKPLMEYLRENKLSYSKYKKAVILYEKEIKSIKNDLRNHFNQLRARKVIKMRSQN